MKQALVTYIIFQSLFFSIVLIFGKKPENRMLLFYFVYLFFVYFFIMISTEGFWIDFSACESIRIIYEMIVMCKAVVVFYFIYSLLEKPMPKPLYWLWSLPVLNLIADYLFRTIDIDFYSTRFYERWYLSFPQYVKVLFTCLLIWQVRVFKKEITENSASKNHHQLLKMYWGKYFVYFLLALSILSLLYVAFTLANGRLYTISSSQFIYSAEEGYGMIHHAFNAFFLLVFGYLAVRNPSVFNVPTKGSYFEQRIAEIVLPEEEKNFQKKIEFTGEQTKQYTIVLNKLMEHDKVYLDPELSLNKLAKLSDIPSRQLSQFIQVTFNKNYKEYVNNHRVKHAQKLLTHPNSAQCTMYSIAFDSGFNSEPSFYRVFKDQTDLTPKQYQDKFKE